ncbi:MAG: hypothetical protein WCK10_03180 [Candidatus Staskawiczbacteria bacterium]
MEKENNNINWGLIITVVVIGVIILSFIYSAKNLDSNQAQNNQTPAGISDQSLATQSSKAETQVPTNSDVSSSLACSQQANVIFNAHKDEWASYNFKGTWSYENHFNIKMGKCFIAEKYVDVSLGKTELTMYDVYENKQIAQYQLWSKIDFFICLIKNDVGECTREKISNLLNIYMETNTY